MDSTLPRLTSLAVRFLAAACAALAAVPAAAVNHDLLVPTIAPGRFAVACSNVEQDAALIAQSGAPAADFWEGRVVDGRPRYITEILAQPAAAIRVDARVPDIRTLYPGNAGEVVEFIAIVCHPTTRANADADYALPDASGTVPHMLPAGAAPQLVSNAEYETTMQLPASGRDPSGAARLPLIVFSHGLAGSPISKGYIDIMVQLATQGYMVAAIFHGDPRFSRVRLEDFGDYWYALANFDRIVEMQLLRPVSLRAMLDVLLAHPAYGPAIDTERIGGFGASMGGQAMAHLLGARITATLGKSCRDTVTDSRIKAAFGYVPYAGQSWLPAFCDDQRGAEGVTRPYLAMTGSADTTSPETLMQQAVNRFRGSRYMVSLAGGKHELRGEDTGDLFTWMVTFFNAYLGVRADPDAMARFIRMARVQGGRDETLVVDAHVPASFDASLDEGPAVEFYHAGLDHFFMAAGQDEIDILSSGQGPGWAVTGHSFKVHRRIPPAALMTIVPVCRFYGAPAGGPNSHFFTADPQECNDVKQARGWFYEGIGLYVPPIVSFGRCVPGQLHVMRAYNARGMFNDSNHRYSTSDSTMREMARLGWIVEGTAWCAWP